MYLALNFRNRLPGVVRNELDQLVAAINTMWDVQHTKDGGLKADSVTTAMLNFTAAESDSIIATINASTEGLRIDADLITINGTCVFASGYDPTGKIASGGAAADVNANATTVNGGKITTNSVTASQLLTDLVIANTIRSSGATALSTGTGYWLDATGTPTFRVGNPSGDYLKWDGTNLSLVSTNLTISSSGVSLVANTAETFSAPRAYSFSGLSTGARAALWAFDVAAGSGMKLDSRVNTNTLEAQVNIIAYNDATLDSAYLNLQSGKNTADPGAVLSVGSGDVTVYAGGTVDFVATLTRTDDLTVGGDLIVDTTTLVVDAGNNRVGIGTASPAVSFDARCSLTSGDGTVQNVLSYATPGATVGVVGTLTNHDLQFYTNNAVKAALTAGGNFGVGVDSPSVACQVNGAIAVVDGMTAPSTVSGYAVIYVDTSDGDLKVKFGDGTVKTLATDS